jgi:hypothetical protein
LPRPDLIAALTSLATFLLAELLRSSHPAGATVAALVGWGLFAVVLVRWAVGGDSPARRRSWVLRVAALTIVSTCVLLLYLLRSGVVAAGPHVDAVYTYRGAEWLLALDNPITFAARTPSYHQFPLMVLEHVPAATIGVWRLGPLAPFLGVLLNVAVLLAIVTERLAQPAGLLGSCVGVALASAAFSNRFLVMGHDCVGYIVPAVCLGLMALVVADRRSVPAPERLVGGLLTVAVLQYYTAFFMVAPLCALWLVARRQPVAATWHFLRVNPPLLLALGIAAITLSVHPELLLQRVHDVTAGQAQPEAWFEPALERARANLEGMRSAFWLRWHHEFIVGTRGTWHLVNTAPLGGAMLPTIAGSFVCSVIAFRGLRRRYAAVALGLGAAIAALTLILHVLTDFSDYRDFTALTAIMVVTLGFAMRAPRLDGLARVIAVGWGLALAAFNWWDVTALHGKVHGTKDYGVRSQAVLEDLRQDIRNGTLAFVGPGQVLAVLDWFYPLEREYADAFAQHAPMPVAIVRRDAYCADPAGIVNGVLARSCESLLLLRPVGLCDVDLPTTSDDTAITIDRVFYPSVCRGFPVQSRPRLGFPLGQPR